MSAVGSDGCHHFGCTWWSATIRLVIELATVLVSTESQDRWPPPFAMLLREAAIEDAPGLVPLMSTLGYPTDEVTLRQGLAAILADASRRVPGAQELDHEVELVLAGVVVEGLV